MGCLQTTPRTKVQPFDHSKENGHLPTAQQNGRLPAPKQDGNNSISKQDGNIKTSKEDGNTPTSKQKGNIPTSKQEVNIPTSKQDGNIPTSKQDGNIPTSKQNGQMPSSKQNGHIPSSTIPDTPRETLGQLSHQNDIYNNNAGRDTRLSEATSSEHVQEKTIVESISIRQDTFEAGLENQGESQKANPGEQTLSARTGVGSASGDHSHLSTSREPVVVPTMPLAEEDLLRSHYTIKEISIHNQSKGHVEIFPLKKDVYSTKKFKEAMKSVVKRKYEKLKEEGKVSADYDYETFYENWKCSPIFVVMFKYPKMLIRFSDIKKELLSCKVAEVFHNEELYEDIIKDSKDILQYLKGEKNITEYQEEYKQLLERFLEHIEKAINTTHESVVSDSSRHKVQDPNKSEFPLPEQIKKDCTVLRQWIQKWQPFDTDVPKEGVWNELPDKVVNAVSDPIELKDICRVSSDGLPDLDFAIEGAAAWNVLDLDIVKNDQSTEQQEKIWRSRDNRTDLNDPMFLLSRQTRLEMYFINKYNWESTKLDPYRGFTARLQRAWKEFEEISKVEEFTVIPDDEY